MDSRLLKLPRDSMNVPSRESKTIYVPGFFEDRPANHRFACSKLATVSIQRPGPVSLSLLKTSYVAFILSILRSRRGRCEKWGAWIDGAPSGSDATRNTMPLTTIHQLVQEHIARSAARSYGLLNDCLKQDRLCLLT